MLFSLLLFELCFLSHTMETSWLIMGSLLPTPHQGQDINSLEYLLHLIVVLVYL